MLWSYCWWIIILTLLFICLHWSWVVIVAVVLGFWAPQQ